jgi:integrase
LKFTLYSVFALLPEPERSLRVLTEEEDLRLVRAVYAQDSVVGALVEALAESGMRISEGLTLKWSDVDLGARRLTDVGHQGAESSSKRRDKKAWS